jgi:hypothetical protein
MKNLLDSFEAVNTKEFKEAHPEAQTYSDPLEMWRDANGKEAATS